MVFDKARAWSQVMKLKITLVLEPGNALFLFVYNTLFPEECSLPSRLLSSFCGDGGPCGVARACLLREAATHKKTTHTDAGQESGTEKSRINKDTEHLLMLSTAVTLTHIALLYLLPALALVFPLSKSSSAAALYLCLVFFTS